MSEDCQRPFGFMLIRYYESEHQVPEMALNPEDIAECFTVKLRFEHLPGKDGKKSPFIPTSMLMACLINAGMYIKLDGKRQMSTAKSTLLPGFITLEDPYLLLLDPQTNKPNPAWEVDMRPGKNPNGGEAVCIVRPRFDRWRILFSMAIDTAQIKSDTIRELVDIAGSRFGLDFRPQRKGIYGQFKVACWEQQKRAEAAE